MKHNTHHNLLKKLLIITALVAAGVGGYLVYKKVMAKKSLNTADLKTLAWTSGD